MKVAALQLDIAWQDREENFKIVTEYAAMAADNGADMLVLPEMFATGFSMDPAVTAEPPGGDTASFMRCLAKENKIGVLGGYVLKADDGKGHNVAVAIDKTGHELAIYSKAHLFSYLGEDKFHEAGDGPVPFEFEGLRCACFICYDLRFPELFRLVADNCDAVFVIASWPRDRQSHWDVLLPARAVENQLYMVGVNRVGMGGGLEFLGSALTSSASCTLR
jgi:omega-amidase